MRFARLLILWIFAVGILAAEELSQADRLALTEKIRKLQDSSEGHMTERYQVAIAAFRNGMASDDAAMELYIKCVLKVEFDDVGKKPHEFREWRHKNEGRLQDPNFHAVLRHQIAWLMLTLEQALLKGKKDDIPAKVNEEIEALFHDPKFVLAERETLSKPVTGTVFAKAYQLESVKVDNWPMNPLEIDQIYDSVILPSFRKPGKTEELRNAWHRRIQHKCQMIGRDADSPPPPEEPGKPATKDPFFTVILPDMVWNMEEDLFRNGDQRGASLRMCQHIERYQSSPKAAEWVARLKDLLNPPQEKPKDAPPTPPAP